MCAELGIENVSLAGGEPTIHPKFDSIVKQMYLRGLKTRLITNGISLIRRGQLEDTLTYLDMCWLSAYGPTEAFHQSVSRGKSLPLRQLIETVGGLTRTGHKIGLSVLIMPDSIENVGALLDQAEIEGIRRIRLLPLQPEGRATVEMDYSWERWPRDLAALERELKSKRREQFEVFTMNSPFAFQSGDIDGRTSCLLNRRRLWSVVSDGDVFTCCFTAYQKEHRVGNVHEPNLAHRLTRWSLDSVSQAPCNGITDEFWNIGAEARVRCPLTSISLK
jgi:MoaA/NifB/PqqE/SkfB family radical SAM enzyme